jgi:hypothetical protein
VSVEENDEPIWKATVHRRNRLFEGTDTFEVYMDHLTYGEARTRVALHLGCDELALTNDQIDRVMASDGWAKSRAGNFFREVCW